MSFIVRIVDNANIYIFRLLDKLTWGLECSAGFRGGHVRLAAGCMDISRL